MEGGGNGGPWTGGCCADVDTDVAGGAVDVDGAAGPKSSRMSVRVSRCGSSLQD